jgi:hypothetical protein
MGEEEQNDLGLADETYLSPLRALSLETHEIYQELKAVGFPEKILAQIIAHMLVDIMSERPTEDLDEADFEDDDDVDFDPEDFEED